MNKGTTVTFRPENLLETNTYKWLMKKIEDGESRTLAGVIVKELVAKYKKEHNIK